MLAKRIIPCLDVRDGVVVKGVQFRNHEVMGSIIDLAKRYADEGADELVFYDITASSDGRRVDKSWVAKVAEVINIPFAVAGGIKSVEDAKTILAYGADKISINSPALADPSLITRLSDKFGVQCVVVGIDTYYDKEPSWWSDHIIEASPIDLYDNVYSECTDFKDPRSFYTIHPFYKHLLNPDERVYKIYIKMSDDLIVTAYERSNFFIDIRNSKKKMSIKNFLKYLS